MDSSGVLVIITSSICGGCKAFKPNVAGIEKLAKNKGIKFIYYEDQQTNGKEMYRVPPLYPKLGKMNWYPFIFYADENTWSSMTNKSDSQDMRANLKILNGRFQGSEYQLTVGTLPSVSDVNNWLNNIVSSSVILDNNEWTLQSHNEVLAPNTSKSENNTKMKLRPRRKYGKKR